MDRIKIWIIPGLMFLLTGCVSYSTMSLDVLKPAKIKIPVDIASVVVVDNAFPFRDDDSAVHRVKLPGREYKVDTIWVDDFGKRTVRSFGEALEARQFFDSVHVVDRSFNTREDGGPMQPMTAFVLDTLCQHFNAQAVISLDHYNYGTTLNVMDMPDYYYATLDARSNTYWKIHDRLRGDILDIHLQRDTIFWDSSGHSIANSVVDLPTIREAIEANAEHSGVKYADFVAPTWEKEERLYYKQGHPLFFRASELISKGQWEDANRIWYHVFEESKGKQKARSAFNLALGQEVLGNFREAAAWALRSMETYEELGALAVSEIEKNKARQYYLELYSRLQEKKKLDEQYGVDE